LIGEVGLGGEVRSVGNIEKRLQEAKKLGFSRAIIPYNNLKGLKGSNSIEIIGVENLTDAINHIIK
jgi:DNA repair protein RadA/Sms